MSEIKLVKRVKYAGDVHTALMKLGWDAETAASFLDSIPDANAVDLPCKPGEYWRDQDGERVRIENVNFCLTRGLYSSVHMVLYSYEDADDSHAVNWYYFREHFTREKQEG